jgi:elongator complex protein 2
VSGAEEKVVRVFESPTMFDINFRNITKTSVRYDDSIDNSSNNTEIGGPNKRGVLAVCPPLGLSNKPIMTHSDTLNVLQTNMLHGGGGGGGGGGGEGDEGGGDDDEMEGMRLSFVPVQSPPLDQYLAQNTLWSEVTKLYGLGNAISAVTVSHPLKNGKKRLIVAACEAKTAAIATPRMWKTGEWVEVVAEGGGSALPPSHTLTVARMAFSPDNVRLLTVSRDRFATIYRFDQNGKKESSADDEDGHWVVEARMQKHSKMIYDCCWSEDGNVFATCARDKNVCLWIGKEKSSIEGQKEWEIAATLRLEQPVTAVAILNHGTKGGYLVAAGLEDGQLLLYSITDVTGGSFELLQAVANAHYDAITAIRFKPKSSARHGISFATASRDFSVRIWHQYQL